MNDWRRLFAYDAWANRETLASLRAAAPPPEKSRQRLAHLVGAGRLWLARLEGAAGPPPAVWPDLSLDQAAAGIEELAKKWDAFVARLDEAAGARVISYVNSKGEPWSSAVADVLLHVVMHGGYHRGQIAADLREAGYVPAYTDYIEAVRRNRI